DFTVLDIRDAAEKARLLNEAEAAVASLKIIGDALIGFALAQTASRRIEEHRVFEDVERLVREAFDERAAVDARKACLDRVVEIAHTLLRNPLAPVRRPFHWPLEFPEVLGGSNETECGFDAFLGNPPFRSGKLISGVLGHD